MKNCFFAVALLCAPISVVAQTEYVTFRLADGTEASLPSADLVVTFPEGRLEAVSPSTQPLTFPLSELSAFYFSAQPTAIASLTIDANASGADVCVKGGRIYINGSAEGVEAYTADGRRMPCGVSLDAGVYLVRRGTRFCKIRISAAGK